VFVVLLVLVVRAALVAWLALVVRAALVAWLVLVAWLALVVRAALVAWPCLLPGLRLSFAPRRSLGPPLSFAPLVARVAPCRAGRAGGLRPSADRFVRIWL
jgi:hypothetical protein